MTLPDAQRNLSSAARPPDAARPLVCMDECTKTLRKAQGPEPAEGNSTGKCARHSGRGFLLAGWLHRYRIYIRV